MTEPLTYYYYPMANCGTCCALTVGYISTSFSGSAATTVFAIGNPRTGSTYDEAMYALAPPLTVATLAKALATPAPTARTTDKATE